MGISCDIQDIYPHLGVGLSYVGMPIVCSASTTYVDLAAAFFVEEDFKIRDDCTSLLTSAIRLLVNRNI
jgi:hypothetical protein